MASNTILVKTNTLIEDAEKLKDEELEKLSKVPPTKSGEGYMAVKLDEMVQNMKDLHEKSLELVKVTSDMLQKMGIEFEGMDKKNSDIYKNIN